MTIDQEFKDLLPPLDKREYSILESDIKDNGCRDPLIVWGDILVDGHNRHAICTEWGIGFDTKEMEFNDRDAVMNWIDNNQLGRRNLTADQYTSAVGRMYGRHKKAVGAPADNMNAKKQIGHCDPIVSTAEKLALDHGVSVSTVKRAGRLMESIEKLKDVDPDLEYTFQQGEAPSRTRIIEAAEVVNDDPEAAKEILHPTKAPITNNLASERGLDLAQKAINMLNKIPQSDKFRDRGFKLVIGWIKANK